MTTPAPTAPATEAGDGPGASHRLGGTQALAWLNVGLIGLQTLVLCVYLWPQWRHNPDLSHGLFMPLVFLLLLWEGRRSSPPRHPGAGVCSLTLIALLAAVALAGLTAAGLFAVSLGWSHSLVSFMLVAAFVTALLAALVALSAAPLSLLPLNWITFVAVVLWLLAAPMPPGTYSTLTFKLQTWVTGHVLTALNVLGVAARQRGNLIDLANTTVGIEEACSGIRSLIACLYAGFFFSALLVRRPWARAVLLLLAAPLAIGMNFVRSLTLTLLANAGVDIGGFWHDATGYSILAVTAIVLVGLAFMLEPRGRGPAPAPAAPAVGRTSARALFSSQAVLCAFLLMASGVAAFFVSHTQKASQDNRPPPDLTAVLPAAVDGWKVITSTDLYKFSDTLQTSDLVQRTYFKGTANDFTQITIYLAFWPAGQTSVSNVAVHTPDACWPGVGWQAVPAAATRFTPVVGGQRLPVAESRLFTSNDFMQHVWFWHLYDGKPITQRDPRSPRELLSIAWRYGFRKDGDQLFVRISSNRPWDAIATEPLVAEIFTHLHAFGL
jgi:exosortase